MKLSQFLFNKFNSDKTVYYDEVIIESEIIKLEAILKNEANKEEVYKKIKEKYAKLSKLKTIRLIEFVLDEMKF